MRRASRRWQRPAQARTMPVLGEQHNTVGMRVCTIAADDAACCFSSQASQTHNVRPAGRERPGDRTEGWRRILCSHFPQGRAGRELCPFGMALPRRFPPPFASSQARTRSRHFTRHWRDATARHQPSSIEHQTALSTVTQRLPAGMLPQDCNEREHGTERREQNVGSGRRDGWRGAR